MSTWVVVAAFVVAVGACAGSGNGAGDPTSQPPSDTPSPDVVPADALGELRSILGRMNQYEGALLRLLVDFTGGYDRSPQTADELTVSFPVDRVEVLWAPSEAALAADQLDAIRVYLSEAEDADAALLGEAMPAVVFYDPVERNTELIALIATPGAEDVEMTGVSFRLGSIADELMTTPLTVVDECISDAVVFPSPGREAALVEHIEALEARAAYLARQGVIEREAELLVDKHAWTDPVTGVYVEPDINDLTRQLQAGVAPEAVEIRTVVPVVVDLTGFVGEPQHGFFLSESGELLGFMAIGPATELFLADIPVPDTGAEIVVESAADPLGSCGELPDDRKVVARIPLADAAGPDTRVLADLATGLVTPLTSEQFDLLVDGAND